MLAQVVPLVYVETSSPFDWTRLDGAVGCWLGISVHLIFVEV